MQPPLWSDQIHNAACFIYTVTCCSKLKRCSAPHLQLHPWRAPAQLASTLTGSTGFQQKHSINFN